MIPTQYSKAAAVMLGSTGQAFKSLDGSMESRLYRQHTQAARVTQIGEYQNSKEISCMAFAEGVSRCKLKAEPRHRGSL